MNALDTPFKSLAEVEAALDVCEREAGPADAARAMLALAEETLQYWIMARGDTPTDSLREGFRLLALHRQGAQDLPSFNACRETCREIAYHYNLLCAQSDQDDSDHDADRSTTLGQQQRMMAMLTRHLLLFVGGKMQVEGLGEFCCASRPLRAEATPQ